MRKHGRKDITQDPIVQALRHAGASVKSSADLGNGFVDLVVGFRNVNYLLECKTGAENLTSGEADFFATWRGRLDLVRTPEEALKAIGAV